MLWCYVNIAAGSSKLERPLEHHPWGHYVERYLVVVHGVGPDLSHDSLLCVLEIGLVRGYVDTRSNDCLVADMADR